MAAMEEVEVHPVQANRHRSLTGYVSKLVTMKAYEVYCYLYSPQEALVTGSCRGGFGVNELIAFLYAASFPKSEWRQKVDEALFGMKDI